MQIIIPMSGFGERFRRAGYHTPKPLIDVDGKPMIQHVVELFKGETDFVFICNEEHLAEPSFQMAQVLKRIAPLGVIVPIKRHKRGPVGAVLAAAHAVDPNRPVIVNYCDFSCYWDFSDFKDFVRTTNCDGAIPAYRGFHPHSLGATLYAYIKHKALWLEDIKEKAPFTDRPMDEFASSGAYYFRNGALCLEAFRAQVAAGLSVNGEFYASLAYKILRQRGLRTAVYAIQHFMQWGTPHDLEEYKNWSRIFRRILADEGPRARQGGAALIPMAGQGRRFREAGYASPKPRIPVSGRPMAIQAARCLPTPSRHIFVVRNDMDGAEELQRRLRCSFLNVRILELDALTEGQAVTCLQGVREADPEAPLTIGACDNAVLFDGARLEAALADGGPDVLVWTVRGHPDGRARPDMFGWAEADGEGRVTAVSVKAPLSAPETDPMMTGAFTFRRACDFVRAAEASIAADRRVNGEFYVDSVIEDAIAAGLDCRLFEVDALINWGTPEDLAIFEYWQSCFHKWDGHPYRLDRDPWIPASQIAALRRRYAAARPARPRAVSAPTAQRA